MSPSEDNSITQWIQEIKVPAALISYSYRALQKKFAKELAPYHIGWGHFAILMSLYENEGRSQDSLALSRGFDKTMIAKSVVKLEEEDLIQRRIDPVDKRVKRLYLTEKSRKLVPEMERIGLGINEILVKDFDKKESKIILEYLRKIALNASEM
ncbi:MAG: MarR family transcriptional regulator [Methanoregula sp.]